MTILPASHRVIGPKLPARWRGPFLAAAIFSSAVWVAAAYAANQPVAFYAGLLAVSILTALGNCDDPLLGHMRAAVRLGQSPERVAGAVAVVPLSAGDGKRAAARALLARM